MAIQSKPMYPSTLVDTTASYNKSNVPDVSIDLNMTKPAPAVAIPDDGTHHIYQLRRNALAFIEENGDDIDLSSSGSMLLGTPFKADEAVMIMIAETVAKRQAEEEAKAMEEITLQQFTVKKWKGLPLWGQITIGVILLLLVAASLTGLGFLCFIIRFWKVYW